MIILASDTSTKSLSVSICNNENNIKSITKQTGTTHAQKHMPEVIELLSQVNLDFADVDLYACTVGPGSYTGIRIGVSTTKSMAYASKKCAVGVSTLETLAFPHQGKAKLVCAILDARNRRVFSSVYFDGELVVLEANRTFDELLVQITEFLKYKKNEKSEDSFNKKIDLDHSGNYIEIVFCGDASDVYNDDESAAEVLNSLITAKYIKEFIFLQTVPEAADVATIAFRKFNEFNAEIYNQEPNVNNKFDPFLLEANYLSPSQAERMKINNDANHILHI